MLLITGDLHITKDTMHLVPALAETFTRIGVSQGCHTLCILGDILHDNRDPLARIPAKVIDAIVDFIRKCASVFHNIIVVNGNHDSPFVDGSCIEFLDLHSKVYLVTEGALFPQIKCVAVPYCKSSDRFFAELRSVLDNVTDVESGYTLLTHMDFTSFMMSPKKVCEQGLSPRDPKLACFRNVITGHFHDPQDDGFVYYVGSPYQVRRGESERKRVILYDHDNFNVTSFDIPPQVSTRFVYIDSPSKLSSIVRRDVIYHVTYEVDDTSEIDALRSSGFKIVVDAPIVEEPKIQVEDEAAGDLVVSVFEEVVAAMKEDPETSFLAAIGEEYVLPFVKG